jgi:hypothetical protein
MIQLNPMLPVFTPMGTGYAFAAIDYSQEHFLIFVIALDVDGTIHMFSNKEVRFQWNKTLNRTPMKTPSEITSSPSKPQEPFPNVQGESISGDPHASIMAKLNAPFAYAPIERPLASPQSIASIAEEGLAKMPSPIPTTFASNALNATSAQEFPQT